MALAIAFLILMVAAPAAVYGAEHTVGDTQGWNQGVNYDTWASGKTFTVGDTLVFNYDSSHKVDEVNLADYNGCSSSNSIKTYEDSPTKITLSKAGPSYYICPIPGHCANGMKLLVNVVAAGTPSGTPPTTTPATPAPPTTTTPANNDSPPPPPPPPKISPASSLHMNLVGVPLVLATLMAVMG
ncbi:putative Blue (type 1) copper binding protein [Rosa chinensis]|uniref:Putative Blue (Type 1) copper binding protein n=1 Tax=Rosa chinensis TaxID=74649 RepID=A0A2P6SFF6_ROSCH|nr:uclacyanin-2 [Rosa chinensis]PRQ57411.1 putative Blue (type 1) copper binding protein [Rosa chinensis]